jgi:hypothetical protein
MQESYLTYVILGKTVFIPFQSSYILELSLYGSTKVANTK